MLDTLTDEIINSNSKNLKYNVKKGAVLIYKKKWKHLTISHEKFLWTPS